MNGRLPTGAYFFLYGLVSANWLAISGEFGHRAQGDGLTVYFAWLVSFLMVPVGVAVGAWAVGVWSARRVVVWAAVVHCLVVGVSVFPGDVGLFAWVMVSAGLANGVVLVGLNCLAAGVERAAGRLFLPWCHGVLALGTFVGSLLWVVLVKVSVRAPEQLTWTAAVGVVVAVSLARFLPETELPDSWRGFSPDFTKLALVGIAAYGTADAVRRSVWRFDVGVEHLVSHLVAANAFTAGAAVGGLVCGVVAARIGLRNLLKASAVTTALGLVVLVASSTLSVAAIGFAVAGAGLAGVFPVMLSLAAARGSGRQSIAMLTVLGYVAGPIVSSAIGELSGARAGYVLAFLLVVPVLVFSLSSVAVSRDPAGT